MHTRAMTPRDSGSQPAACVKPRLVGCVDDAHADVPSRRRVVATAVQSVQQVEASAGHSSTVSAGCTDEGLPLGLARLVTTQPGLPSCRTSQLSCRTSSSRGLRAWRDAVPPLARAFSSSTARSTVSPSSSSCSTLTSCSLTTTTALHLQHHSWPPFTKETGMQGIFLEKIKVVHGVSRSNPSRSVCGGVTGCGHLRLLLRLLLQLRFTGMAMI